jgi:hypothetical protein
MFKGGTAVRNELAVSVRVGPVHHEVGGEALPFLPWTSREAAPPSRAADASQQQ